MKVQSVKNVDLNQLLDLDAAFWKKTKSSKVSLAQTPLALQPTPAIRQEWENKAYGRVKSVRVSAAHNGRFIAFRLQWNDPDQDLTIRDNNRFVDAAAIMLGVTADAPIMVMGAPGKPVNALYWRADEGKRGRNVVAEGIGTSETVDTELVVCNDRWDNNTWELIIARPMAIESDVTLAQLPEGQETPFGIAIWEGSGGERAGIKAFGQSRDNLVIEKAA